MNKVSILLENSLDLAIWDKESENKQFQELKLFFMNSVGLECNIHKAILGGTLSIFFLVDCNGEEIILKTHLNNQRNISDLIKSYFITKKLYSQLFKIRLIELKIDEETHFYLQLPFFKKKITKFQIEQVIQTVHTYWFTKLEKEQQKTEKETLYEKVLEDPFFFSYYDYLIKEKSFFYLNELFFNNLISDVVYNYLKERFTNSITELLSLDRGLCHGDLNHNNIMELDDGLPVIIDWEDSFYGPTLYDIAFWLTFIDNNTYLKKLNCYFHDSEVKVLKNLVLIITVKKCFLRFLNRSYLTDKISILDRIYTIIKLDA
jgi:hypothetical protein